MNFVFRVGLPHGSLGLKSGDLFRDAVECRAQIALCFRICTLHANEITRTNPLIQVYYVRVVNLDIEAGKWGNLRDQCGDYFDGSLKNNTKVGNSGSPRYQAARFSSAETTICCDRFRSLHRGQPHCARNSPSRRAPSDLPSDAGPGGCRTNMHCHRSMAESSPAIACSFETNSPANLSHRFERRQV